MQHVIPAWLNSSGVQRVQKHSRSCKSTSLVTALEVLVVLWSPLVATPTPTVIGEDLNGGVAVVQQSRVSAVAIQVGPGVLRLICPCAIDVRIE